MMNLECNDKLEELKKIAAINNTAVILNEVDAIQSRCISMQTNLVQQGSRLQRLVMNWRDLNNKAEKIENVLNQPALSELVIETIYESLSEDELNKKLLEYKVFVIFHTNKNYLFNFLNFMYSLVFKGSNSRT